MNLVENDLTARRVNVKWSMRLFSQFSASEIRFKLSKKRQIDMKVGTSNMTVQVLERQLMTKRPASEIAMIPNQMF